MAALSKTKKIESLTKLLHKRYKGLPTPPERTVLEHLAYAALLENASFELTDAAFAVLEHYFIDWNEIRVSTVYELADTFSMLPDPSAAGLRLRLALQGVFDKTYMFDLEDLNKKGKNLGQAVEFLESLECCSRFMIDYTTQAAFGGHVIPLDEAALRIFRLLGMTQVNKEGTREEVPGLERAVPKKNGLAFSLQLHHFAAEFFGDPESVELRNLLKPIDPEALERPWIPPVLASPKQAAKPTPKPIPPVTTVLPFDSIEDDDFDEEHVGTEAAFIGEDGDDSFGKTSALSALENAGKKNKEKPEKSTKGSPVKTPKPTAAATVAMKPEKEKTKEKPFDGGNSKKKNESAQKQTKKEPKTQKKSDDVPPSPASNVIPKKASPKMVKPPDPEPPTTKKASEKASEKTTKQTRKPK